jgi:hypothetical protein
MAKEKNFLKFNLIELIELIKLNNLNNYIIVTFHIFKNIIILMITKLILLLLNLNLFIIIIFSKQLK